VLYVVTASAVRCSAVAFVIVIARDTCSARAEMTSSATLADNVAWRHQSAAAAQAEAAGSRWCNTIVGHLIQLWLYRLFVALGSGSFVAVIAKPGALKSGGDDEASRRRRPRAVAAA